MELEISNGLLSRANLQPNVGCYSVSLVADLINPTHAKETMGSDGNLL